jgi:AcrR family transcriptional regulator
MVAVMSAVKSRRAAKAKIQSARQAVYREHILDAAERVFADSGYEEAKVVAMATAAGVSLATVYRSFEAKWDIYRAVHARRTGAMLAYLTERIDRHAGPLELLLAGTAGYIEFHMQHPHYLRMHLRGGHVWSSPAAHQSPEQIKAWNQGLVMLVSAFEAAVRAGLCVDERPDLMARTMVAMHQVRLGDWVDRGMKESVADVTRAVHRELVRAFCTAKGAASVEASLGQTPAPRARSSRAAARRAS